MTIAFAHPAPPTQLRGARVLLESGWRNTPVTFAQGRITGLAPADPAETCIDLPPGSVLAPGFIDLQVNGGASRLFNNLPTPATIAAIGAAHRRTGTTSWMPTLITDAPGKMHQAGAALRDLAAGDHGVIGLHFEGPFISPAKPGVHDPRFIRAIGESDMAWLIVLARDLPDRRILLTLAPEEVPPAHLARLAEAGVILSAGHTAASAAQTETAIAHGLRGFTHLFNAMPAPASRAPGPAAVAMLDAETWCGVIADGHHVDPRMLRLAIAAKPARRIFLVTDAMPPLGTDDRGFQLYGRRIKRADGWLRTADGVLAGADIDMAASVRNAVALLGCDPAEALRMASTYPAEFLRIDGERGRIAIGQRADLVLLTADLHVIGTWRDGMWEATGRGLA